jgi:hypothetical protein
MVVVFLLAGLVAEDLLLVLARLDTPVIYRDVIRKGKKTDLGVGVGVEVEVAKLNCGYRRIITYF